MNALTFETVTKEQQKELQKVYSIIDDLRKFGNKANLSLFQYLFGEKEGKYQIQAFKQNNNVIYWLHRLTSDQKGIVLANIYYNETLYSNC